MRRYAGYDGTPDRRSLPKLLHGHIVGTSWLSFDEEELYRDMKTEKAQVAIGTQLREVERHLASPR